MRAQSHQAETVAGLSLVCLVRSYPLSRPLLAGVTTGETIRYKTSHCLAAAAFDLCSSLLSLLSLRHGLESGVNLAPVVCWATLCSIFSLQYGLVFQLATCLKASTDPSRSRLALKGCL